MQDGAEALQLPSVAMVPGPLAGSNNRAAIQRLRPTAIRRPGTAVRSITDAPPIPPPRPESTLTENSKPIVPAKIRTTPAVPSLPPRVTDHLVMVSIPPPSPPPVPPMGSISLTSPRPGTNRSQNVYVDAPLRSPPSGCPPPVVKQPLSRTGSIPLPQSTNSKRSPTHQSELVGKRPLLASQLSVIQPVSSTLKKRSDLGPPSDFDSASSPVTAESIICRDCGRCRCKACREPRRLPEHYLCHKKCPCSSETVVDTLSGMCLVKALFYHCGKDYVAEADSVFENPCSCTGDYTVARWGCMAGMSLLMPCLLCYLPMRGCSRACEAVYAKMTTTGCRCDSNKMSDCNARNNNADDSVSTSSGSSSGMPSPVDSEKRLFLAES